jgi:hypothetical protein
MRNSHQERPPFNQPDSSADYMPGKATQSQGGESIPSSGKFTMHSEVLDGMQALAREFDVLSPAQVRNRLSSLISKEQEVNLKREV